MAVKNRTISRNWCGCSALDTKELMYTLKLKCTLKVCVSSVSSCSSLSGSSLVSSLSPLATGPAQHNHYDKYGGE